MEGINFLLAVAPAGALPQIADILNWAEKEDFEIAYIVSTYAASGKIIQGPNGAQGGAIPALAIFAWCTSEKFKEFFGFEYSSDMQDKIFKTINEKQGAKDE